MPIEKITIRFEREADCVYYPVYIEGKGWFVDCWKHYFNGDKEYLARESCGFVREILINEFSKHRERE